MQSDAARGFTYDDAAGGRRQGAGEGPLPCLCVPSQGVPNSLLDRARACKWPQIGPRAVAAIAQGP